MDREQKKYNEYQKMRDAMLRDSKKTKEVTSIAKAFTQEQWDELQASPELGKYLLTEALHAYENNCVTYSNNKALFQRIFDKVGKVRLTPFSLAYILEACMGYNSASIHLHKTDEEIFEKPNYDFWDMLVDVLQDVRDIQETRRKSDTAYRKNTLKRYGYIEGTKLFNQLLNADSATFNRDLRRLSPSVEKREAGKKMNESEKIRERMNILKARKQYEERSKKYAETNS